MPPTSLALLVAIGFGTGLLSGVLGIGGGVVIVPALVYLLGFDQHLATGTSLAVLLPPVGLAAVVEYYRHGRVNMYAALVLAATMAVGGWLGAVAANHVVGPKLQLGFAIFLVLLGIYLLVGALRNLGAM